MSETVQQVRLADLRESPTNPRQRFHGLAELAESIRAQGVLQPLVARHVGDALELVFGHRRLRAAKLAGLKAVPVVVRELADQEVLEQQLVENLQREDVHELELAEGYRRLLDAGMHADQLAERLGVSRASVYAAVKLLDLMEGVRKEFLAGRLSAAAARAIARVRGERLQLAALRDVQRLAEAHGGDAPVRKVERLLQQRYMGERSKAERRRRRAAAEVPDAALQARVAELLLSRVLAQLERAVGLDDTALRWLLLALAQTSPAASDRLSAHGVRLDRLAGLRSSRLRVLLAEALLGPWVAQSEDGRRALARAYGVDLAETESTARALLAAEGVVSPQDGE